MNIFSQETHWNVLIEKLRKRYPQLDEADFQHEEGQEESMLRMIEYKLSKTKEEFQEIIDGL